MVKLAASELEVVLDPDKLDAQPWLLGVQNGQSTSAFNGLDSQLNNGDVLAIVPPVGGG